MLKGQTDWTRETKAAGAELLDSPRGSCAKEAGVKLPEREVPTACPVLLSYRDLGPGAARKDVRKGFREHAACDVQLYRAHVQV